MEPLLLVMLNKLLTKGHTILVVETHPVWCGFIKQAELSTSSPNSIEVKVANINEEHQVTHLHSFNITQPERWKLTKREDGQWCLYPPRTSKTQPTGPGC